MSIVDRLRRDRERDELHLIHHFPDGHPDHVPAWAAELNTTLGCITKQLEKLMATIDELAASVQSETSVVDSVVALLVDIKAKLDAVLSGTNIPPAVQAKIDEIFAGNEASKKKLADAILANTPAA